MKRFYFIVIGIAILISTSCNSENELLTQSIIINDDITVMTPDDYILESLQGIDSYAGRIINPKDSSFLILIDIGELAGLYVDPDATEVQLVNSSNSTFVYQKVESQYLSGEDCCVFFTFPDLGPANFATYNNHHFKLVLDIMKSLRSNE